MFLRQFWRILLLFGSFLAAIFSVIFYPVNSAMAQSGEAILVFNQTNSTLEEQKAEATGPETGLPLPRFVSLNPKGAASVNVRSGPGVRYPILWVFKRPSLPVQITAEYGLWRRILDLDGDVGWVHKSLLSGRRTAIITRRIRVAYREPEELALAAFTIEPGAIVRLQSCVRGWCRVRATDHLGWMRQDAFWGTFENEIYDD